MVDDNGDIDDVPEVQPLRYRATDGPEEDEVVADEVAAHAEFLASNPEKSPLHVLADQIYADALSLSEAQAAVLQMLDQVDVVLKSGAPVNPFYLERVTASLRSRLEDEEIRASRLVSLVANVSL